MNTPRGGRLAGQSAADGATGNRPPAIRLEQSVALTTPRTLNEAFDAIEAEARAAALDEARAAVEGIDPRIFYGLSGDASMDRYTLTSAALAAIDALRERRGG